MLLLLPALAFGAWSPFESTAFPGYAKIAKTDVPFSNLRRACAPSSNCTLATIAAACTADDACGAFNTDGYLKARTLGCAWGSNHCVFPQGQPFAGADLVDLFVKQGSPPPQAWEAEVRAGSVLYAQPEPNLCYMPEIGNGYVASIVGFASMHLAGLYTGKCGSTHKARLPSPIAGIHIRNSEGGTAAVKAALDTRRGLYLRRYPMGSATGMYEVEQRIFAHRTRKHVLVTEFELVERAYGSEPGETGEEKIVEEKKGGAIPPFSFQLGSLYDFHQDKDDRGEKGNGGGHASPTTSSPSSTCPNPGGRVVTRPDGSKYPYFFHCATLSSDCGQCFTDKKCVCDAATHCCVPGGAPPPPTPPHNDGNGCAGTWNVNDITWGADASGDRLSHSVHTGHIADANDDGTIPQVVIVVDIVPTTNVTLSRPGQVVRFVAVVIASLGDGTTSGGGGGGGGNLTAAAVAEYTALKAMPASSSMLLDEHIAAWNTLTKRRIEVGGVSTSPRAWQLQGHFWSSYYFLMSSIRADWSLGGLSPGGLSSQNYEGAVFMDQELYMAQGLLLFQPALTKSAAQYRIDSAPVAEGIAKTFGYDGMMFAWTSAAKGNPFGCCNGHGGFENCIEQHITPDVLFFFQQIYRATGDAAWLKGDAWPVILGIARWAASRVTAVTVTTAAVSELVTNDGSATAMAAHAQTTRTAYSIKGVMPIDEWCDQSSGCASPGVDDDAQMNAMTAAAMRFAVEAAAVVGWTGDNATKEVAAWGAIAAGLIIPYNASLGGGVHTMPVGRNGLPVISTPRSYSCPEDINYLSYPLGPSLGVDAEGTRRDMQWHLTTTCLENPGMVRVWCGAVAHSSVYNVLKIYLCRKCIPSCVCMILHRRHAVCDSRR